MKKKKKIFLVGRIYLSAQFFVLFRFDDVFVDWRARRGQTSFKSFVLRVSPSRHRHSHYHRHRHKRMRIYSQKIDVNSFTSKLTLLMCVLSDYYLLIDRQCGRCHVQCHVQPSNLFMAWIDHSFSCFASLSTKDIVWLVVRVLAEGKKATHSPPFDQQLALQVAMAWECGCGFASICRFKTHSFGTPTQRNPLVLSVVLVSFSDHRSDEKADVTSSMKYPLE